MKKIILMYLNSNFILGLIIILLCFIMEICLFTDIYGGIGDNSIEALYISDKIKIDGILNEPVWEKAVPVSDFTQRELNEGEKATEKTEVRIVYDKDNLYIGIMCYDSEPDKIIHNELKRDGSLYSDDNITIILDTYKDFRSGFFFEINPNSARKDALISGSGRYGLNFNWDGVWDVGSKINGDGWSAEIIIPFKTLRFPKSGNVVWGFNVRRMIQRKNEEVLWQAWSRNDGILQLSKAGLITGLENIQMGRLIELKPFSLGGIENPGNSYNNKFKYGLDIKYPITSNLILDLTTLTDFAQVESDRTQINLTRFDLRYSEKRNFFLEESGTFSFRLRGADVFYSRRIGITPDRQQVPILGGARFTGKLKGYRVGFLNIQTDKKDGTPSTNYTVIRMKRDFLEKSYIGFIATNLYNSDRHKNQAFGVDFSYRTSSFLKNNNVIINGTLSGTLTDGQKKENLAGGISINYPNDLFNNSFGYYFIQENFNPEIGFVPRTGTKYFTAAFRYTPRPKIPLVKKITLKPVDLDYLTDINNNLLTRKYEIRPLGVEFKSGDNFEFNIINRYEYLDEDFNIFGDVIIPGGVYEWWNNEIQFQSKRSRQISLNLRANWGNFYTGKRTRISPNINFKLNKNIAFSTYISYNNIKVSDKWFEAQEYGGRFVLNVSTKLTSRTFVQWNNEDKKINMNFLIRYIPKIGSNIYFVYNQIWDGLLHYGLERRTGIAKIEYLFRF